MSQKKIWSEDIVRKVINKNGFTHSRQICVYSTSMYRWVLKNGGVEKYLPTTSHTYWTVDTATAKLNECKSKPEFYAKYRGAYDFLVRNGYGDVVWYEKKQRIYNEKTAFELAKNYGTLKDLRDDSPGLYNFLWKNGYLDDVCKFVEKNRGLWHRMIYAFEFPDNCVYVGLTYNFTERRRLHFATESSQVYIHKHETGLTPKEVMLTDYLPIEEAKKAEGEWVEKYRKDGWKVLNIAKTGGVGGSLPINHSRESCLDIAKSCTCRAQFRAEHPTEYKWLSKHKILEEVCQEAGLPKREHVYNYIPRTLESALEELKEFRLRAEVRKKKQSLYLYMKNNHKEVFDKIMPPDNYASLRKYHQKLRENKER